MFGAKNNYLILSDYIRFEHLSNMAVKVKFYDNSYQPEKGLTYSLIAAICKGQWIFVRHRDKLTWEIAGGHIEKGETPEEAAGRELTEETGAFTFRLHSIATYSVESDFNIGYGRLFLAEVTALKDIVDTCEIEEIILSEKIPDNLTYPDIQPLLFEKVLDYARAKGII
jgi:8-oxo-dGTP diphosphatase